MSASRTKNTYLPPSTARSSAARGKSRARKAIGHSLLVAIWHMLNTGVRYHELGHDWFEQRNSPDPHGPVVISQI